jgi:hypothetical protein
MIRDDHKAPLPFFHVLRGKESVDSLQKCQAAWFGQAHEEQSSVGAWAEAAHVGKVQILGYQEASFRLCRLPDRGVIATLEPFVRHRIDIVTPRPERDGER